MMVMTLVAPTLALGTDSQKSSQSPSSPSSPPTPPQPWAARDHLLNSVHAQLVAPQDSNLLDVFQSIPAKEQKMLDVNDVDPYLASTFDTIWSLNQAVEPNWTLFRFSAVTYQSNIDISDTY